MTRNTFHDFPSPEVVPGWWEHDIRPEYMGVTFPSTPWDERLLNHIETHLASEMNAAGSYESLAEMGDPQVNYLAQMIAADEHRHNRMLIELMDSVRSVAGGERDESSWAAAVTSEDDGCAFLVAAVAELIRVEKSDAADLKLLQHELRSAPAGTLWPVIVEIMQLDTEKHLRILKAIERVLKRRPSRHTEVTHLA